MGVVLARAEVVRGLEPLAAFTVPNVRAFFDRYEEICPTPALWDRAFFELFGCFASPEASSDAFAVLDTDGNGLIDARETFGALAVLSKGHLADRMSLLFDIFDLNKEKEMAFDECFILLRRAMAGLRKMVGILTPPEKVIHNMVKQVWKSSKKHRDMRIVPDDWHAWWSSDSSIRAALKMVTWRQEEHRGLPTPDQWINIDYTKGISMAEDKVDMEGDAPKGKKMGQKKTDEDDMKRSGSPNLVVATTSCRRTS